MLALSASFAMPLNAQSDMEDDPFFKAMKQDEMNKLRKAAAERAFKGAAVETGEEEKKEEAVLPEVRLVSNIFSVFFPYLCKLPVNTIGTTAHYLLAEAYL
jgi:hypothetical protein